MISSQVDQLNTSGIKTKKKKRIKPIVEEYRVQTVQTEVD